MPRKYKRKYKRKYRRKYTKPFRLKQERIKRERIKKEALKKPKHKQFVTKPRPLTSEDELKRARTEVNNTNRRRAKQMERRVANYLKGKRVPASGAMMGMKGDCYIPLLGGGQYLIECKLSANRDAADQPQIVLSLFWFEKIMKDARAMNARFGVLVIHYHRCSPDYVFIPEIAMKLIAAKPSMGLTNINIPALDISTLNGKTRKMYKLPKHYLEAHLVDVRGIKIALFNTPFGLWYVLSLSDFRDIMEGA